MSNDKIKPPIINGREVKVGDKLEGLVAWTGRDQSLAGVIVEITQYDIVIDTPQGEIRAPRAKVCDQEPMKVFRGCTECSKEEEDMRLATVKELPGLRFCDVCLVEYRRKHPKVVVLCGSSRFVDMMAVCGWYLERDEGAIAMGLHLLPGWYSHEEIPDHLAEHEGVADKLDELHLRKIDLADEVFVVNVHHYIGESTTREVEYAKSKGIPIRWFTDDELGDRAMDTLSKFLGDEKLKAGENY